MKALSRVRVACLALAIAGIANGFAAAQTPSQSGAKMPAPAATAPPLTPAQSVAGIPGCTNVAPGSTVAQKSPGSGEMTTSATGMMTDPGRHTLPCPAAKRP